MVEEVVEVPEGLTEDVHLRVHDFLQCEDVGGGEQKCGCNRLCPRGLVAYPLHLSGTRGGGGGKRGWEGLNGIRDKV